MAPVSSSSSVADGGSVRIERILCPVDFSDVSAKAYRYAQSIACHYHAKLILQNVVEVWQYPSGDFVRSPQYYDEFSQALTSSAEGELQRFVDLCGGVEPECLVEASTAADAILCLARARDISLVVMGTHGRRGFDHLMLGSVTERVLRYSPCPVLAIPQKDPAGNATTGDSIHVRRILCCVDFSTSSQQTVNHALSVADAYGAELTALHIMDDLPESTNVAIETDAVVARLQRMFTASTLPRERVHLEVRVGKAYREIVNFAAQDHSDLVVTGACGRNSLDLAVFGSTTYRIIQLYTGPVLTIPVQTPRR